MFRKKKKEESSSEKSKGDKEEEEETYKIGSNNTVAKKARARFEKYLKMFNKTTSNSNFARSGRKNNDGNNSTAPSYGRHSFRTPQPQRAYNYDSRSSFRQPLRPLPKYERNATAPLGGLDEQKLVSPRDRTSVAAEQRMSTIIDEKDEQTSLRHQDGVARHRSRGEVAMQKKKNAEAMRQTSLLSSQQRRDQELQDETSHEAITSPSHSSSKKRTRRISSTSSSCSDDSFSMPSTTLPPQRTNYDKFMANMEYPMMPRRATTPIAEMTSYDEFVDDMRFEEATPSQPASNDPTLLTTLDMLQPNLIDAIHSLESSLSSPTTSEMRTIVDAPTDALQRPPIVTSSATTAATDEVFYDAELSTATTASSSAAAMTSDLDKQPGVTPQHQQAAVAAKASLMSSSTSINSSCYETASDDGTGSHVQQQPAHDVVVVSEPAAAAASVTSQRETAQEKETVTVAACEMREGREKGDGEAERRATAGSSSSCAPSAGDTKPGAGDIVESTSSLSSNSSFEILESIMPTLTPVKKVALWKRMSVVERKAKLRQAWKKHKDLPVSDDESVFSDGGSSDDYSDIDEEWLNEGADTDDSCISRVDYHNNNNSKRRQKPQITTSKPTSNKKSNSNNNSSAAPPPKKEPVQIQKQTKPAAPQKAAPVVVKVIEQNDVIPKQQQQQQPRIPTLVANSKSEQRKPDVIASSAAKHETNSSNDSDDNGVVTEAPKVNNIRKMWERLNGSKNKHTGFDASRDSDTFNGNTLGRLNSAKALFQNMSSSRTPHLPRKTSQLQQEKEDDLMASQTLPRSFKGTKKRQPISNLFEKSSSSSSSSSSPPVSVAVTKKVEAPPAPKVTAEPPKMVVKESTDVVAAQSEPKADVEEAKAVEEEEPEEAPKTVQEIKAKLAVHSNSEVAQKKEEPAAAVEPPKPQEAVAAAQEPLKMLVKEDEPFEVIEPVAAVHDNEIAIEATTTTDEAAAAVKPEEAVKVPEVTTTTATAKPKYVKMIPLKKEASSVTEDYDGNFTDDDLDGVSTLGSETTDDDEADASLLDDE